MLKKLLAVLILIQFTMSTFSQNNTYFETEWKKIDTLPQKEFITQSTLTKIEKLLEEAKKAQQIPYTIKAYDAILKHKSYLNYRNPEALDQVYEYIQSLKSNHPDITCEVIELIESKYLIDYRNNYYYELANREVYDSTNNLSKFSLPQLDEKIIQIFQRIIQNKTVFANLSTVEYRPIIEQSTNAEFSPYLFDVIALDILSSLKDISEQNLQPSAYQLTDTNVLSTHEKFAKLSLDHIEFTHLKNVFSIYQQLIQHYQTSGNKELLAYIDFNRLKFAYSQLMAPNKSTIYYNELFKQFKNFPNTRSAAWYGLAMGNMFYQSGQEYHPFDNPTPQYDLVKAAEIYKKIDAYFKETKLESDYIYQYNNIQTETADLSVHPNIQASTPILATLRYKNIKKIQLNVYQLKNATFKELIELNEYSYNPVKEIPKSFLNHLVAQKSFSLKSFNDHQVHTTDIYLDPLPIGTYYVQYIVNNQKTGLFLNISNFTYVNNEKTILVLDKRNAGPVSNAKVNLWKRNWDSKQQKYKSILETTLTTDQEGKIILGDKNSNYYYLEIEKANDRMINLDNVYLRQDYVVDRTHKTTKFYLDRAIYRPGQSVYFKGIAFSKNKKEVEKIAKNAKIKIEVFDVNDNVIFKENYTTNEFGSISGDFKLPASTLGGSFYIKATDYYGTQYFRVEEYKRPKYKVEFEKSDAAFQLNDSIEITGKAMAYAGYPIQNAKVNYTVKRLIRLPRWGFYFRPPIRFTESVILTSGIVETDAQGKFKVPFKAIPANNIDKKYNPMFSYEISATVTDLSGETHDVDHNILLGWNKYEVVFGFYDKVANTELHKLPLSIQNFQGQKQVVSASLLFTSIEPPKGIYHERSGNAQKIDVITIDSIQFKKLFPHEIFYREEEPSYWKELGATRTIEFNSTLDGKIDLSKHNIKDGWYKLQVKIPGEIQEPITYVQIYNGEPTSMYYHISSNRDKPIYEYNENAKLNFTTNLPTSNYFIYTNYETVELKQLAFEKIQSKFDRNIQLTDKAQSITITSIKDGRLYTTRQVLYPQNPAQKLEVKVIQMKDTLLPGEKASFEIQVTGNTKEVEILTGMYDASLDVFAQNHWQSILNNPDNLKVGNWNLRRSYLAALTHYLNPANALKENKYFQWEWATFKFRFLEKAPIRVRGLSSFPSPSIANDNVQQALAGRVAGINLEVNREVSFDSALTKSMESEESEESEKSKNNIRENFNETAFFLPSIKPDENGKATIEFTIPDALTEWKWMIMAHNTDLGFSYLTDLVVTQKDLMVETNVPRFLRQGDSINYIVKLINVGNHNIKATLNYAVNNLTNQSNLAIFSNPNSIAVNIPANSTQTVDLAGIIPQDLLDKIAIILNVTTDQPGLQDAVKNEIEILPNSSVLVGTRNFYFNGNGKYKFNFPDLKSTLNASTLSNAPVMISMNLNPSWEVINALPYIGTVKYESSNEYALQIYANALAAKIIKDNPGIKENIDLWKKEIEATTPKGTLEDLAFQAISKESSPWLAEAENEKAHKAAIIHLFNEPLIKSQIDNAFEKLRSMQRADGGFSWFKGGNYSSTYITTNILTLMGELIEWKAIELDDHIQNMLNHSIDYLDQSLKTNYRNDSAKYLSENIARYLHMRTMYKKPIPSDVKKVYDIYLNKYFESWDDMSLYGEIKMGIVALKHNNEALSKRILTSLIDRATISDTLGMYWKENTSGYLWSQNQLLVQASLIEFFELMGEDINTIHQMQKWLLRLKETNRWENAASTANIIKAFFVKNPVDFNTSPEVKINFNKEKFDFSKEETKSGYIKIYKEFDTKEIKKDEVNIDIKKSNPNHMIWGNIMWKYQLPFDQIQPNDNELKIQKKIYYQENNVWKLVQPNQELNVGTKVKVVMTIQTDRTMGYIHIQDDRAANMEPVNQMSGYRYDNGMFYYQSIKDANNHFFIDNLPVGTREIEYECFINQTGKFYNGVSVIESYYAPNYRNQSNTQKIYSK